MASNAKVNIEVASVGVTKATKETKTLREQIKDLKNEMANLTQGTEEYDKAAHELGNLMHQQAEISADAQRAMNDYGQTLTNITSISAGVVGSFSAMNGVMNLIGASSEESLEAIKKIQSLMAIVQGLSSMDAAEKAFRGLWVRIKSVTSARKADTQAEIANTAASKTNTAAMKAQSVTAVALRAGLSKAVLGFRALTAAIKSFMLSNPLTAVLLAITAIVSGVTTLIGKFKEAKEQAKEMAKELEKVKFDDIRLNLDNSDVLYDTDTTLDYAKKKIKKFSQDPDNYIEFHVDDETTKKELEHINSRLESQIEGFQRQADILDADMDRLKTKLVDLEVQGQKDSEEYQNTYQQWQDDLVNYWKAQGAAYLYANKLLENNEYLANKANGASRRARKTAEEWLEVHKENYKELDSDMKNLASKMTKYDVDAANTRVEAAKKAQADQDKLDKENAQKRKERQQKELNNLKARYDLEKTERDIAYKSIEKDDEQYYQALIDNYKNYIETMTQIKMAEEGVTAPGMLSQESLAQIQAMWSKVESLEATVYKKLYNQEIEYLRASLKAQEKQYDELVKLKKKQNRLKDTDPITKLPQAEQFELRKFYLTVVEGRENLRKKWLEIVNAEVDATEKLMKSAQAAMPTAEVQGRNNDTHKANKYDVQEQQINLAEIEANEAKADELRNSWWGKKWVKLQKYNRMEVEAEREKNDQLLHLSIERYDEEQRVAKENFDKNLANEELEHQKKLAEFENTQRAELEKRQEYVNKVRELEANLNSGTITQEQYDQGIATLQKDVDERVAIMTKYANKRKELDQQLSEGSINQEQYDQGLTELQGALEQELSMRKIYADQVRELNEQLNNGTIDQAQFDERMTALDSQLATELDVTTQFMATREAMELEHQQNLQDIRNQYDEEWFNIEVEKNDAFRALAQQRYEFEKSAFEAQMETMKEYASALSGLVGNVSGLLGELQQSYEQNSKEYEAIEEANIIMSTITGSLQAFASAQSLGWPWGMIIGAVNAGIVTATGITALYNLKNKSMGSLTSSASNVSTTSPYQTFITETGADIQGGLGDTRVWVAETDISDTINKVTVAENESTF